MDWKKRYRNKVVSPGDAVRTVKSGDKVVLAGVHPKSLALALARRKDELRDVTVLSHWETEFPWFQSGWEEAFHVQSAFVTRPSRQGHIDRRFDYVPSILGMSNGVRQREAMRGSVYPNADVFMVKVTPPNQEGWCSFGHAVWFSQVAARTAKTVLAEVDDTLIWTYGNAIRVTDLDYLVEAPPLDLQQITAFRPLPPDSEARAAQVIGSSVADMIKNGDTLQIGTGTPSEAVGEFLSSKSELGFDSEIMCSWMLDLIKAGVVTGERKNRDKGKHALSAFMTYPGDPEVPGALKYLDHNPDFLFRDSSRMCDISRISANHHQVSVNTVLAIDLTGQAVVTHLGPTPLFGAGGQLEYCVGAQYSKGGRSITCLLSTARNGTVSRIVPRFESGAMVLIPNVFLDYLVTEYGVVNLNGKSMRQRAEAIISVAHPDFRPELKKAAKDMFWP